MPKDLKKAAMDAFVREIQNADQTQVDEESAGQAFDDELEMLEKHDTPGSAVAAGAAGLASGLSFGLSDQFLTKSGIISKDDYRALKKANPIMSVGGELAGAIGPAFVTGGTSLAAKVGAKGLKAALKSAAKQTIKASPAAQAFKAGKIAEKSLANVLKSTGNEKFAKSVISKVIPKTAGSAVEGALFGAGELIREEAIGEADFNAENAISHVGLGAVLGGAGGALFGGLEVLAPLAAKVVGKGKKAASKFTDPAQAALELVGVSPAKRASIKNTRPGLVDDLTDVLRHKVELGLFDDTAKLSDNFIKLEKTSGKRIQELVDELDELAAASPELRPTYADYFAPLRDKMDDLSIRYKNAPGPTASKARKKLQDWSSEFDRYSKLGGKMSPADMNKFRKVADESIKYGPDDLFAKLDNRINYTARKHHRDMLDKTAEAYSNAFPDRAKLSSELSQANKDFAVAKEFGKSISSKAEREFEKSFLNFRDILAVGTGGIFGGPIGGAAVYATKKLLEGDAIRKMKILANMEKANQGVGKKISKSVESFFSKSAGAASPTSVNALLKFDLLGSDSDHKKPKTRKQAMSKFRDDVVKIKQDPTLLVNKVNGKTLGMQVVAPQSAGRVSSTALTGVQFLSEKMPVDPSPPLFGKRDYVPSDLDLAKFERYVQAVADPLSTLEDLEQGTLTREQVEALQAVYPKLYAQIQETVMAKLVSDDGDVPYERRLTLGILLQIPTDKSLDPAYMRSMQANFGAEPVDEPSVPGMEARKISATGMSKVNIAERTQTPTQDVMTGNPGD